MPGTSEKDRQEPAAAATYGSSGSYQALPGLVGYQGHDPRSDFTRGPAYTFAGRRKSAENHSGPGPCNYEFDSKLYRTGKDGAPRVTVRGRMKEPVFFNTPGPGTDWSEEFNSAHLHRAPAYSLRGRYEQKETDVSPGPNIYRVPPMMGRTFQSNKKQAPCFSIKSRSKNGAMGEDLKHSPGPAVYDTVNADRYKVKAPGYSMRAKPRVTSATLTPSPATYKTEEIWAHKRKQPRASFGVRHSTSVVPLIVL